MRSLLTIATVSSKHSGKYRCVPSQVVFLKNIQHQLIIKQRNAHQVTPDSATVLVKSHADIGHSEPVTNLGGRQDGTGLLGLFFAIFAMTSFRSRQDWKAGGSLLFMVASFSLCAICTIQENLTSVAAK